jgi:membrane protease YdiL (CAAX protease family)
MPLAALWAVEEDARLLFPSIWVGMGVCLTVLWRDPTFDRSRLWRARAALRELPWILARFALVAVVLYGIALLIHANPRIVWPAASEESLAFLRGRLEPFGFPSRAGWFYILIMVMYPVVSVYPQEVMFRVFFTHRYAVLFRSPWAMVLASGLAFGWAHIVFQTWIAVVLCIPGGMLFCWTYLRTKSALAAWIDHTLIGDWVFTVGLGWLFFSGSVGG